MSSSTTLRVVTAGVGCGPCPTSYPERCRPCAQSRGPGSDKPLISSQSSTVGFRVILKESSSSPKLHLEGVF
jgi:hypothetical protein